ncbi:MAG TPA: Stk1 family PASTA domain-containing Ser/Thr kinase, partial [Pedococcus sp.]|nr:Stk1 family PASTA domain-containing Ser/Thr kinase [Pedococcus sp.]
GRTVAVKRLRTDLATDPTFQARFRREAQAAAGLNHPNIVSVYDTGEEMAPDGSHVQPYIVMEYVQGRTLREVLNDGRKVLPERALEIIGGVLAALDYSHRAGIVHRDIKPGNVMLTPSGQVKVMDFGIARAVSAATNSMTQTSAVVGTAQYLSPEQARGETVDSRSDLYSAGCLLYELLTGRPPFVGDSPFSVAYQHVREQADPPSVHNPDIAPALDAIVMKALAKRVEDRYQGAAEMQADIQRYLDGQPVDAPTTVVAAAPVVAAAEPEPTSLFRGEGEDEEDERRRTWPIIALILVLLLLLGGAVLAGMQLFGSGAEQVEVPDVTNMTQENAVRRLQEANLKVGDVERANNDTVPRGRVISQDPDEGDQVDEGTEIDLVVSAGKEDVVVKYVIGMSKAEATRVIQGLGLDVDYRTRPSTEPKNVVVATDPNPGESVPAGSTVTLILSEGEQPVPNVVGRTQGEATALLEDAGFDVSVELDDSTPSQRGIVLRQDPAGDTEAPEGSTVTITVSDYEEPEPTPSPGNGNGGGNGNGNGGGGGPDTPPGQTTEPTPTEATESPAVDEEEPADNGRGPAVETG